MLLDSNIIIYAATGQYPQLMELFGRGAFVSAVSKIEVLGYPRLTPEDEADFLRLFQLLSVLPISDAVIDGAVKLRRQHSISVADAVIASTAQCYKLTLVTRNVSDFRWIEGLPVLNPIDVERAS